MIIKYLSSTVAPLIFIVLVFMAILSFSIWRVQSLKTELATIRTELHVTKTALKAQQDTFTAYRTQTNTMLQQLNAANAQAATDQQHLQDAIKNEDGQNWGNARLPDAVASVLNQK